MTYEIKNLIPETEEVKRILFSEEQAQTKFNRWRIPFEEIEKFTKGTK